MRRFSTRWLVVVAGPVSFGNGEQHEEAHRGGYVKTSGGNGKSKTAIG